MLTIVERLHAAGVTKLYDGPIQTCAQVEVSHCHQALVHALMNHLACKENLHVSKCLLHAQVLYIIASMAALDYLHDAWFYWTHRLLHGRLLYKHVHAVHHK